MPFAQFSANSTLMDAAFLGEVRAAVELSLKGDPDSVSKATSLLGQTLPEKKGFLPALMTIAVDNSVSDSKQTNLGVRKAAAIIFGKEIKVNWKKTAEETRLYSEEDKELIRQGYFDGLVACNDQSIVKLLGHALHSILIRDIETWTTFEDQALKVMTESPTHEKIYCALVGLHSLTKVRQYYVNEDREPISKTSAKFFPPLLELGLTLCKDLNPVNALLAKEITKIFYRTIRVGLV